MVCKSCRSQTRSLVRAAMRQTGGASSSSAALVSAKSFLPAVTAPAASMPMRNFSQTPSRSLFKGLGKAMTAPYHVLGATEVIFKNISKTADYQITEAERNEDRVQLGDGGEEIGHSLNPNNVWHKTFNLPPTFNTWSHVTMLQLFLINARIRCFDRETFHNWQSQLTDHFFFECEKKMHVDHHITSSAVRQRYLKDIFVQWRGLILAYDEGLIKGDAILASAVWRNLFKGSPDTDPRSLVAIVGWMRATLMRLEATPEMALASRIPIIFDKRVDVYWLMLENAFLGKTEYMAGTDKMAQRQPESPESKESPKEQVARETAQNKVSTN